MKKLLPILLFCILTVLYSNATDVSGLISTNTTWTKANSPYVVTGNILVSEGIILTIEPGTEIRFDASKAIQINGTLIARGTADDSIRFTSNTVQEPGAWGNITFDNSSIDAVLDNNGNYLSGCALEYCVVEYGGKGYVNMVNIYNALPFIRFCKIKKSFSIGLGIDGISNLNSYYSIKDNEFANCALGLSILYNDINFVIEHCTFLYNILAACGSQHSTTFDNCTFSYNNKLLNLFGDSFVKNCVFSYNNLTNWSSGYVLIENESELEFSNNLIYRNGPDFFHSMYNNIKIQSNIFAENFPPDTLTEIGNILNIRQTSPYPVVIISNNIFTNNNDICPLLIRANYKNSLVENNSFTNNYSKGSIIKIAHYYNQDPADTNNIVFKGNVATQNISPNGFLTSFAGAIELDSNNLYNNTSAYSLKNDNSPTQQPYLDISNNYWGVNTTEELSEVVYDFFDDANLGITVFDNVLLSPPAQSPVLPPAQVKKTDMGNGNVKVSWDSNPDDAIGYNVYWGNYSAYTFAQMADAGNTTSYIVNGVSVDDRIAVTAYDSDYIHGKKSHTWQNDNMLSGHESPYSFDIEDLLGVSIPESTSAFNFYPNPVTDRLIIEIDINTSSQFLNIVNLQGQILKTALLVEQKTEINLIDFPSGMYLIQLCGKNGCKTEKLIKL